MMPDMKRKRARAVRVRERITVDLGELRPQIIAASEREDRSISQIVKRAIKAYLANGKSLRTA
jgi:hypothetical protein